MKKNFLALKTLLVSGSLLWWLPASANVEKPMKVEQGKEFYGSSLKMSNWLWRVADKSSDKNGHLIQSDVKCKVWLCLDGISLKMEAKTPSKFVYDVPAYPLLSNLKISDRLKKDSNWSWSKHSIQHNTNCKVWECLWASLIKEKKLPNISRPNVLADNKKKKGPEVTDVTNAVSKPWKWTNVIYTSTSPKPWKWPNIVDVTNISTNIWYRPEAVDVAYEHTKWWATIIHITKANQNSWKWWSAVKNVTHASPKPWNTANGIHIAKANQNSWEWPNVIYVRKKPLAPWIINPDNLLRAFERNEKLSKQILLRAKVAVWQVNNLRDLANIRVEDLGLLNSEDRLSYEKLLVNQAKSLSSSIDFDVNHIIDVYLDLHSWKNRNDFVVSMWSKIDNKYNAKRFEFFLTKEEKEDFRRVFSCRG